MPRKLNLLKEHYGRWTVIGEAESTQGSHRRTMWLCRCVCGVERTVNTGALRRGDSTSCGCYNKERVVATKTKGFNDYEYVDDCTVSITLTGKHGGTALIDAEDLKLVQKYRWYNSDGYACSCRLDRRVVIRMHQVILADVLRQNPGLEVDHKSRDRADNRKCNLRLVTQAQNRRNNSMLKNNTSGYMGVDWNNSHKRWRARVVLDDRAYHVGYFKTPEEAARARDDKARELHGEFASLNFPDEVGEN